MLSMVLLKKLTNVKKIVFHGEKTTRKNSVEEGGLFLEVRGLQINFFQELSRKGAGVFREGWFECYY